jgi:arginyl-tRNA synthetase
MNTLSEHLSSLFEKVTNSFVANTEDNIVDLKQATQDRFGHYQYNSAMRFSKLLGKPPKEIAMKIIAGIERIKDPLILKVVIVAVGK